MALSPTTIDILKIISLLCCISLVCLFSFVSEIGSHYVAQAFLKLMIYPLVSAYQVVVLQLYAALSGAIKDFEIPSTHKFFIALRKGVQTHVPYVLPLCKLREKQTQ